MAISANAVWELRADATASNVNGGFFVTGASGTDYSQQAAAQYNLTGVTTAGADAILLSASAAANMVGNAAHIISGTNFTAGWYEIISVVAGVSITLDRTCTTGAGSVGVVNIGGAISLGAANDDAVFEAGVAGNTWYVRQGTYTLGGTVTIALAGTHTSACTLEGYAATRGDRPKGSTRPTFVIGGTTMTTGTSWIVRNMIFTNVAGVDTFGILATGLSGIMTDCKVIHLGSTADRAAIYCNPDTILIRCEAVCRLGNAVNCDGSVTFVGCYFHDSNKGVRLAGTGLSHTLIGCVISNNKAIGISFAGANTLGSIVYGCTIYGTQDVRSLYGVYFTAGCTDVRLINNIIYGHGVGVFHGTAGQDLGVDMNNIYYNNTTDVTDWVKGTGTISTALSFAGVTQLNGTTATTNAAVLTDGAADFTNVTANQDYCYIVSGTGLTAGHHLITGKTATTLTLSPAPGTNAVANTVYFVATGNNYAPSTNALGTGFPGELPAATSTSYEDIGGVQTQYGTGSSGTGAGSLSFGAPGFGL